MKYKILVPVEIEIGDDDIVKVADELKKDWGSEVQYFAGDMITAAAREGFVTIPPVDVEVALDGHFETEWFMNEEDQVELSQEQIDAMRKPEPPKQKQKGKSKK